MKHEPMCRNTSRLCAQWAEVCFDSMLGCRNDDPAPCVTCARHTVADLLS